MRTNIAQYIASIISDNRDFIIENNHTVADYLLAAGVGIEEMGEYLSDADQDAINAADDSHAKERELAAEVAEYIRDNYNYRLNN